MENFKRNNIKVFNLQNELNKLFIKENKDALIGVIREAGKIVLQGFCSNEENKEITQKESKEGVPDYVTVFDKKTESTLRASIRNIFPKIPIIGEEEGGKIPEKGFYFLIDPIDGTTNFKNKIPYFAISVGLIYKNGKGESSSVAGFVYDPLPKFNIKTIKCESRLFSAIKGQGVFLNGISIKRKSNTNIKDYILVQEDNFGTSNQAKGKKMSKTTRLFSQGISGMRKFGSTALDLCEAILNNYIIIANDLKPYDIGALAIAEEAGIKIENLELKKNTIENFETRVNLSNSMINILSAPQEIFEQARKKMDRIENTIKFSSPTLKF